MAVGKSANNADRQVQQGTDKQYLVLWRRFAHWFRTVFLRKKAYVAGDTYRFMWQKVPEVQSSFVYYRLFHVLGNLFCFIISFFHIFRIHPKSKILCEKKEILCFGAARVQYEWCFYVTSIGLTFNLVQSIWGFVLTVLAYFHQKEWYKNLKGPKDSQQSSKATVSQKKLVEDPALETKTTAVKEHRIFSKTGFYWCIHSFSLCLAVIIDIVFWTVLYKYNPTLPSTYIINQIAEHGINFLLMATDYCVVAFPVLPSHFLFTLVVPIIYNICNYFYFLAGGKNENRTKHYVYAFLDWKNPAMTISACVGVTLAVCIVLIILLVVDHYKFKIWPKSLSNVRSTEQYASPESAIHQI